MAFPVFSFSLNFSQKILFCTLVFDWLIPWHFHRGGSGGSGGSGSGGSGGSVGSAAC